jgi:cytochrome b6-f complex iron-sulfur subunit
MYLSRRDLLRRAWGMGGFLLAIDAGWMTWESLRPLARAGTSGRVALGAPDRFPDGTATYILEGRFYVSRVGDQFFAISQRCPHLGCRVPFCESSGRFECPCHGSVFDLAGEWIAGPAPRGMDGYAIATTTDGVTVDLDRPVQGPPLGTSKFLTPARGPSCADAG